MADLRHAEMSDRLGIMELATLHDCLTPPVKDEEGRARLTVDLGSQATKTKLERICARHGITPSRFFRNVAERICQELGDI